MSAVRLTMQRGMAATRYARCLAAGAGDVSVAVAFARRNFGDAFIRAGEIAGGGFIDGGWGEELALPADAQADFVAAVNETSVVGALMPGFRLIPMNTRTPAQTSRASAGFVGGGEPIPVSAPSFDPVTLERRKVGALVVISKELATSSSPRADDVLRRDLIQAAAEAIDAAFLDPAQDEIASVQPASVTYGVSPVPSTGDPSRDVAALIEDFPGDLSRAYWICSPITAARMAQFRDAGGQYAFPGLSVRGGDILGIPVVTTRAAPVDSEGDLLALIDPSGICVADDGIEFAASTQAVVNQNSTPTSESTLVSLFQADAVGVKVIRPINWQTARPAVSWTWASYPASS